jgi:hypothetical protein
VLQLIVEVLLMTKERVRSHWRRQREGAELEDWNERWRKRRMRKRRRRRRSGW